MSNIVENANAILLLTVLLVVLFFFIDPREFLQNLGYASLAVLSLVELIRIVRGRSA